MAMDHELRKKIEKNLILKFTHPYKGEHWDSAFFKGLSKELLKQVMDIVSNLCLDSAGKFYELSDKSLSEHAFEESLNDFTRSTKKFLDGSLKWIFPGHPHYPKKLFFHKKQYSFFAIGNTKILKNKIFTIIGSRKTSAASQKIASQLGFYINETGHTIASGGAIGIDIASQLKTLNKKGSEKNILVVLPGGVCNIVPKCHERIIKKITQNNGCLVSTPHPYASCPRFSYILRNQFLVKISDTLFVIQANKHSGALSTAEYAIDQGVETAVWSGELNDIRSAGSRKLIAEGAQHFSNEKSFPFIV